MKTAKVLLVIISVLSTLQGFSWGFWAHKKINHVAVFTLPDGMFGFYKANIDYLTTHAVDADKRRFSSPTEGRNHFIDLDHYKNITSDSFPRSWKDAVSRYSEDSLLAHGIVPFAITNTYYNLVEAFRARDSFHILKLSADLGHYVADAHVPLHTTSNYDGQLTGQSGIHAFWESSVPELVGDDYDYFIGKADYIPAPLPFAWKIVIASHTLVDSVLSAESHLSASWPPDDKFTFDRRGTTVKRMYTSTYTKAYNERLNGMAEKRLREAIMAVGSLWMSAWIDAGQPDLTNFPPVPLEKAELLKDDGTWLGRPE